MKVGDKIILKNARCKINRPVVIKHINKDSVVLDYGLDSTFDIRYSLKTGVPSKSIRAWDDFKINEVDLIKLRTTIDEIVTKT